VRAQFRERISFRKLTASFRREHPSVFFEIIVSDSQRIVDKVSEHDLIIGIVGAKLEARNIQYTAFLDDELIAIGAPKIANTAAFTLVISQKYP